MRNTGNIFVTVIAIFTLLVAVGCSKKVDLPKDHITQYKLFNQSVLITRTETTQHGGMASDYGGSTWSIAVKLNIVMNEPGVYLFEGWVENYRAHDTLGETWKYSRDESLDEQIRDLHSPVYRLEIFRVTENGDIQKDNATFPLNGATMSGLGKPSRK